MADVIRHTFVKWSCWVLVGSHFQKQRSGNSRWTFFLRSVLVDICKKVCPLFWHETLSAEFISPLPYTGHAESSGKKKIHLINNYLCESDLCSSRCRGQDLIPTTHSPAFSPCSHLLSIPITQTRLWWKTPWENRSKNGGLFLGTKRCLASLKAKHCDVLNMTCVCLVVFLQHKLKPMGEVCIAQSSFASLGYAALN